LRVVDVRGVPLGGAIVTSMAGDTVRTTGDDGVCVVPADCDAIVKSRGFVPAFCARAQQDASPDGARDADVVVMERGCLVSGVVADGAGMPIPGAEVTIDFDGVAGGADRHVDVGDGVMHVSTDDATSGLMLRTVSANDGSFHFAAAPRRSGVLAVERFGFAQTWKSKDGQDVHSPYPLRIPEEASELSIVVKMHAQYVAAVCGVPGSGMPREYIEQVMAVSWDTPSNMIGLPRHNPQTRRGFEVVMTGVRKVVPDGVVDMMMVAIGDASAATTASLTRDVGVSVLGMEPRRETAVFVPLATWDAGACTIVDCGRAPRPCEFVVESPIPPRVASDSGYECGPVAQAGNEYRFLIPPGPFRLLPRVGLFAAPLHAARFEAVEGGTLRAKAEWRLARVVVSGLGRTGHASSGLRVGIRGDPGRLTLHAPVDAMEVALEPGEYEFELLDAAGRRLTVERVVVAAETHRAVVLRMAPR
jgi:hypothetical protein